LEFNVADIERRRDVSARSWSAVLPHRFRARGNAPNDGNWIERKIGWRVCESVYFSQSNAIRLR